MKRAGTSLRTAVLLGAATMIGPPALANWTASGYFKYQDREWDSTGFTGTLTDTPIRFADVQVIDPNKTGGAAILANGKTNELGRYSIAVTDSQTRTVIVKVFTTTTQTSDLYAKVTNPAGIVYTLQTPPLVGHDPNTNKEFDPVVALALGGGEAFNILDMAIYGADYIKALTGSRPNHQKLITFKWQISGGPSGSSTSGNIVTLRDSAGYDDGPILHEWGHYITYWYSRESNPNSAHNLEDCDEEVGLAFDEGRSSALGLFVRRYFGMPYANWYVRTYGGEALHTVYKKYNLENVTEYYCPGYKSEISVSRAMWDIHDSATTTDDSHGTDDNPPDALALADLETWQVLTGPIDSGTSNVNMELFWDGWFDSTVANGYKPEMISIFSAYAMEFFQDAYEPNNSYTTAALITQNTGSIHNTYFYDPDGDGKGQADTDYFKFSATAGTSYTLRIENVISEADTKLEILDTNGSTVLQTADPASVVPWGPAPTTGTYYVRTTHHASTKVKYGSYDLSLQGPLPSCGTTSCPATICLDPEGDFDFCHPGFGSCSGNVNTGWNICSDGGVTRSCPGSQKVHLHTCPCSCFGGACGTRLTYMDCE